MLALWAKQWDFVPDLDDHSVLMWRDAFSAANWPWMAARAGTPDWRPPTNALCWADVSPEEHAECVRQGEEERQAYWAEQERAAVGADT